MINLIAMDMGYSLGLLVILGLFQDLSFGTIFSLAQDINGDILQIIAILLIIAASANIRFG